MRTNGTIRLKNKSLSLFPPDQTKIEQTRKSNFPRNQEKREVIFPFGYPLPKTKRLPEKGSTESPVPASTLVYTIAPKNLEDESGLFLPTFLRLTSSDLNITAQQEGQWQDSENGKTVEGEREQYQKVYRKCGRYQLTEDT